MRAFEVCLFACVVLAAVTEGRRSRLLKREEQYDSTDDVEIEEGDYDDVEPCQCGVFMSQQVGLREGRRGRPRGPPQGEPVVTYDTDSPSLPCGGGGNKHCISKCLDVILKYLPKAGPVICGAVERDIHREKAFLFIRNCGGEWMPTSFSAGKEFCCTDGQHHKCDALVLENVFVPSGEPRVLKARLYLARACRNAWNATSTNMDDGLCSPA